MIKDKFAAAGIALIVALIALTVYLAAFHTFTTTTTVRYANICTVYVSTSRGNAVTSTSYNCPPEFVTDG